MQLPSSTPSRVEARRHVSPDTESFPLFVYSRSKPQLDTFPARDVPLGILPQLTSARSQVVSMLPGDSILLITDGFSEWETCAGEKFGTACLERIIRSNDNLAPE